MSENIKDNALTVASDAVVEKSGNKTFRIYIEDHPKESGVYPDYIQKLIESGCSYELMNHNYFAFHVPADLDFAVVYEFLVDNEAPFELVDPTYEEVHGDITLTERLW